MKATAQACSLFMYNPQLAQTTLEILNADFLTVFAFLVAEMLIFSVKDSSLIDLGLLSHKLSVPFVTPCDK